MNDTVINALLQQVLLLVTLFFVRAGSLSFYLRAVAFRISPLRFLSSQHTAGINHLCLYPGN